MNEIIPNANAKKRTKERLQQHGPIFKIERKEYPECFNGLEGVLVDSKSTGYRMWLLCSEIEIKETGNETNN